MLSVLSSHDVAVLRRDTPYSLRLIELLDTASRPFTSGLLSLSQTTPTDSALITLTTHTRNLLVILSKIRDESSSSPELTFELAVDGLHTKLSKLSRICSRLEEELGRDEGDEEEVERTVSPLDPSYTYPNILDAAIDVNESVFAIAAIATQYNVKFPSPLSPLTVEERQARAPMTFQLASSPPSAPLLISQVSNIRQGSQDDVGFVMWPSAVLLAAFCLNNPQVFRSRSVLELGAGCGLTGQAVGRIVGDGRVTLTDFNLTIIDNLRRNVEMNELSDVVSTKRLDFYEQSGESVDGWVEDGFKYAQVDVIIAADVVCKDDDAVACSNAIFDALKPGGVCHIISGTGEHRYGVDIFQGECIKRGLSCESVVVTAEDILVGGEALELGLQGLQQCAGWIPTMTFWQHEITKKK